LRIIELKNLTKKYSNKIAVDNINISVEEGEFYGFIGPNAAGKSTTINSMLNFIFPTAGSIKIFGFDSIKDTKKIKELVGYVPSEVFYDDNMTVRGVLKFTLSYFKHINENEIEKYAKIFNVDLNKKMGELSLGTKKKVAVIQAIITKPKLLILDEPTNGLDPIVQNKLFEILTELNKEGVTIFMSSHALDEVQKYCTKVAVIREGKIIKEASISELLPHNSKAITIKCLNSLETIKLLTSKSISNMQIIDDSNLSFIYAGDINMLLKTINEIEITDINITNINLEDIFESFYTDNEEVK